MNDDLKRLYDELSGSDYAFCESHKRLTLHINGKCKYENVHYKYPNGIPKDYDSCPSCGEWKSRNAMECNKCQTQKQKKVFLQQNIERVVLYNKKRIHYYELKIIRLERKIELTNASIQYYRELIKKINEALPKEA